LGANGTLAKLTLNDISAGMHVYAAKYPADSFYGALTFGSVSVTVQSAFHR